ncbi:MAG: hypothetical protein GY803_10240 [Chloroflexi bacterium]|nr:hypothetical protein [Chloroflexota bacterium]
MKKSIALFILLCLVTAVPIAQAQTNTEERQEVQIRLRDASGQPLANTPVSIVRVYDQAPMGERQTSPDGEASWSLQTGYEYEIVLPEELKLSSELETRLGEAGYSNMGFRLGLAGTEPQPPIVMGLVLAHADGEQAIFWDKAPDAPQPQPDIPEPGEDHTDADHAAGSLTPVPSGDEDDLTILLSSGAVTPVAETENETQEKSMGISWGWIAFAVLVVALVMGGLWLMPVFKEGDEA